MRVIRGKTVLALIAAALLAAFALAACNSEAAANPTATARPAATATTAPTAMATTAPAATVAPTATATQSPTPAPQPTATPLPQPPIIMLVAASLADAMNEIAALYKTKTGSQVTFSFGASGTLAGQVKAGAPADAVIFAGANPMNDLQTNNFIVTSTRRDILTNKLVVISPEASGTTITSLADIESKFSGKVAVGDTASVPAGQYAMAALQSAQLWDKLQARLLPSLDVRAVAAAVAAGNAEFGFVYATDAAVVKGVKIVLEVPPGSYPPVIYPIAVVAPSTKQDAAKAFIGFLLTPEVKTVFQKYGFQPV